MSGCVKFALPARGTQMAGFTQPLRDKFALLSNMKVSKIQGFWLIPTFSSSFSHPSLRIYSRTPSPFSLSPANQTLAAKRTPILAANGSSAHSSILPTEKWMTESRQKVPPDLDPSPLSPSLPPSTIHSYLSLLHLSLALPSYVSVCLVGAPRLCEADGVQQTRDGECSLRTNCIAYMG